MAWVIPEEDGRDWEFTPEDLADDAEETRLEADTIQAGVELAVERGRPVWIRGQVVVQPPLTDPDPPYPRAGGPVSG